jgi:hypothetical protein
MPGSCPFFDIWRLAVTDALRRAKELVNFLSCWIGRTNAYRKAY